MANAKDLKGVNSTTGKLLLKAMDSYFKIEYEIITKELIRRLYSPKKIKNKTNQYFALIENLLLSFEKFYQQIGLRYF